MFARRIQTRHGIAHAFVDYAVAVVVDAVADLYVVGFRFARRPHIRAARALAPFKALARFAFARTRASKIVGIAHARARNRNALTVAAANRLTRIPRRTRAVRRFVGAIAAAKCFGARIDAKAVGTDAIAVLRAKCAQIVGQRKTRRALLIHKIPLFARQCPALRPAVGNRARRFCCVRHEQIAIVPASAAMQFGVINSVFIDKIFVDFAVAIVVIAVANLLGGGLTVTHHSFAARAKLNPLACAEFVRNIARAPVQIFVDKTVAIVVDAVADLGRRRLRIACIPFSAA